MVVNSGLKNIFENPPFAKLFFWPTDSLFKIYIFSTPIQICFAQISPTKGRYMYLMQIPHLHIHKLHTYILFTICEILVN